MKRLFATLACSALILQGVAFAQVQRQNFVIIPYGWLKLLIFLLVLGGGVVWAVYARSKATKPGKAGERALTALSHILIWIFILLTLYPFVNLLGISLSRISNLSTPPPEVGNILVRSGVLPDPANFSLVQYQKVLSDTHILPYQVILFWVLVGSSLTLILCTALLRTRPFHAATARLRSLAAIILIGSAAWLIFSVTPEQFYSVNAAGEHVNAASDKKVVLFIRNTLLVSGMTGLFAVLISTTAGYAFARMKFKGRYNTLLSFVFVQMFPTFMALVAIFYLMNALELLNTFVGLILAYSAGAISFASWIFKGYLESISPSLEEAALVDGCTRWGAFWRIVLPLSVPMLLFIFLSQFIATYSEFILANVLLTGDDKWTVGIGLRAFTNNAFQTQWGTLAASAVLGSLPILIIFYAFQNALTAQTTAGGVKG